MRKIISIGMAISLVFLFFVSCEKKVAAPKAGKAKAEDMLRLIPREVMAVFFVDLHQVLTMELADKSLKDEKTQHKLQEFIQETGIDPQKDIFFLAGALTKEADKPNPEGMGIINLRYNKETLLARIKEEMEKKPGEKQELLDTKYSSFTIYSVKWEHGEGASFCFLDDSNIVVGNENEVKSVIDVLEKKTESVLKNEALSQLLTKTNKEAMFWAALHLPPEMMNAIVSQNPNLSDLASVSAACLYFDYANKAVSGEIKVMSVDSTKNQQVAEFLNGIRALGGLLVANDPDAAEVLNRIEISSGADHVKIYISIPEELLDRMGKKLPIKKEKTS